ncbi:MAG: SDR family NAD(P)-dependent oxidoreductase [Reichenbachiella sp.]|uniref:SDR family NAD(P)-dependent oxidoreductase n=1 Tax=Reichenbachiella sp. TaxID=2184521 RepID=UPI003298182E
MKKHILITGSTDGIGKLTAIKLAKEGHQIYLHGRNQDKLNTAISDVISQSGNKDVKGFVADFSDLKAVKQMSTQVTALPQLDVLINNAGVYNGTSKSTDLRMIVNYLAPVLLTTEIIPLLQKGNDPRIINLSSAAQSSVSLDVLKGDQQVSERDAYAQSKLALTMWSFDLAKKLKGISVIAVNPGSLLHTKMALEAFGNSWSSADKGAEILYKLAISDEHQGVTGKYFDNDSGSYTEAHPDAYDDSKIHSLMNQTNKITVH